MGTLESSEHFFADDLPAGMTEFFRMALPEVDLRLDLGCWFFPEERFNRIFYTCFCGIK